MKLVAVDKTGSTLCLIDAETLQVLKRLPMPVACHDMAICPRDGRIFVSIYGSGTYGDNPMPGREIIVVDMLQFEQTGSIDIAPYTSPHGLTFDGEGLLWASCDAHACLLGINAETGVVLQVVSTRSSGTHWALASVLTGYLYTSNKQDPFLSVIDPTRTKMIGVVDAENGSEGICFNGDGSLLYVADHKAARVLVVDAVSLAVSRTIELFELEKLMQQYPKRTTHHMRVCVSADGTTLAVAAYHFDKLILVNLTETDRQVTLQTGKGPVAMAFHPGSRKKLYFSNHDEGTIGVIDTQMGIVIQTVDCGGGIEAMRFL